eukprot:2074271-Pleurochrysis_carterae.AAC.1
MLRRRARMHGVVAASTTPTASRARLAHAHFEAATGPLISSVLMQPPVCRPGGWWVGAETPRVAAVLIAIALGAQVATRRSAMGAIYRLVGSFP